MNFQEVFLIMLPLFANLKLISLLFFHKMFLFYKLETFTNCKEVKHIMVMIISIIYILLSYEIFGPPSLFFHNSATKNSKSASPPLSVNIESFSGPFCRKQGGAWGMEDTMLSLVRMVSFFPILV